MSEKHKKQMEVPEAYDSIDGLPIDDLSKAFLRFCEDALNMKVVGVEDVELKEDKNGRRRKRAQRAEGTETP